jgi:hypothetical protein
MDPDGAERTTMGRDAQRTDFRSVTQSTDTIRVWQLGVYPDHETAHQAYIELYDAIDRCTTGPQSDRHPRDDVGADEAFVKTFHKPAGKIGNPTITHTAYAVARVGAALVAHELDEKNVTIRDPRASKEPTATAIRDFLRSLCDHHRWCHT